MNRRYSLGAIGFPAFLLAWTTGLVSLTAAVWEPSARHGSAVVARGTCGPGEGSTLADVTGPERGHVPSKRAPARDLHAAAGWQAAPVSGVPILDDPEGWSAAMGQLARHSEVMNGTWQPDQVARVAEPEAAREVAAAIVAAVVLPATLNRGREAAPTGSAVRGREAAPTGAAVAASTAVAVRKSPVSLSRALNLDKARARSALRAGQGHEAYAALRPQVAAGRSDSEFLGLLALAALHTGNDAEALVLYRRLAGLEPASGRWHAGLALARERLGMDATDDFREALALSEPAGALQQALQARLGGAT